MRVHVREVLVVPVRGRDDHPVGVRYSVVGSGVQGAQHTRLGPAERDDPAGGAEVLDLVLSQSADARPTILSADFLPLLAPFFYYSTCLYLCPTPSPEIFGLCSSTALYPVVVLSNLPSCLFPVPAPYQPDP